MSRIGKKPIEVPAGVIVSVDPGRVTVSGPKGELRQQVPQRMQIAQEDGQVVVTRPTERGEDRALHGLTRTLLVGQRGDHIVGAAELECATALELLALEIRLAAGCRIEGARVVDGRAMRLAAQALGGGAHVGDGNGRLVIRGVGGIGWHRCGHQGFSVALLVGSAQSSPARGGPARRHVGPETRSPKRSSAQAK